MKDVHYTHLINPAFLQGHIKQMLSLSCIWYQIKNSEVKHLRGLSFKRLRV
jgi:hypothetical protein